ncbi:flagellar hook-length control protein FliK [Photobacterium sp. ZSDE20]|uniref:Flagellar hook-length control protein FliK n=1 Tax=Photobacterium pectinilyticum TaxID=2906793 RepID=A0ABT1N0Q5_9GAMM|nr:flagellar hook-length control protein FliK [Photobacterium sp. ZSDE20]MCQ1058308.1 flagellar hook-length control protein FliK [Photobacterium sp. ZSDE20]MDD1823103.1 flagellar hook-length control protein FliK [Photobacterium sp. ZSDE20]
MFLSHLFKTDTVPAAPTGASKSSAATESLPGELDAAPEKGFSQTLQGAMGKEATAEPVSLDAEAKTTGEDGNVASTQKPPVGASEATDDVAQHIDKNELIQDGSLEAEGLDESDGKKAGRLLDNQAGSPADDEQPADDSAASAAGHIAASSLAKPDNAKSSMSEGEELLQRLTASRSQLSGTSAGTNAQAANGEVAGAGTDGKLLPPGAEALSEEAVAEQNDLVGKDGLVGKYGKDAVNKAAVSIDGLVAQEKDGAAQADGKQVKGEHSGKFALSGMALTNGESAELKAVQGKSPFQSAPNSELAALMGQSLSSGSLKDSLEAKGNASALAATSLDDGLSSQGEVHGSHAVHRSAAAGILTSEGEKPGTAQPPLLLSKEQAGEQLADKVQVMMSKNLKHVDIRLDPPELGKLQIKLSMNNDQASVQITVANQQSRDLVEQAMPRLRELLQQQGLQLAQSTVQQDSSRQFAGGSQQQANGQPGSSPQHGSQGSGQADPHGLAQGTAAHSHSADLWMTAPKDGVDYYA